MKVKNKVNLIFIGKHKHSLNPCHLDLSSTWELNSKAAQMITCTAHDCVAKVGLNDAAIKRSK